MLGLGPRREPTAAGAVTSSDKWKAGKQVWGRGGRDELQGLDARRLLGLFVVAPN